MSAHKAHVIALSSSVLFLALVAGLKLVVLIDPDGGISEAPPFLLTVPWSLLALGIKSRQWDFAAVIFFGSVNATLVYLVIRGLIKGAGIRAASVVLIPVALAIIVAVWILNRMEHDAPIRIVNGGQENGIWLATDSDGLRAMDAANSIGSALLPEMRKHFIFIPNKTEGTSDGSGYLLQDGRIVDPYPTTLSEMKRDHVKYVEKIRIKEGPNKGIKGWADSQNLQRILIMP